MWISDFVTVNGLRIHYLRTEEVGRESHPHLSTHLT
jgi:hypothetical protein